MQNLIIRYMQISWSPISSPNYSPIGNPRIHIGSHAHTNMKNGHLGRRLAQMRILTKTNRIMKNIILCITTEAATNTQKRACELDQAQHPGSKISVNALNRSVTCKNMRENDERIMHKHKAIKRNMQRRGPIPDWRLLHAPTVHKKASETYDFVTPPRPT